MGFIENVAPHAVKMGKKYNVLPSLIIAQAVHESNWGKSGLATRGLNLFGVKGEYKGSSVTMRTQEHSPKRGWHYIDAPFRKYPSYSESIEDLCSLYNRLDRYAKVVGEKDYAKAAKAVKAGGYATDPTYADKVIATIQTHDLTKYDGKEVQQTAKPTGGKPVRFKTVKKGDTLSGLFGKDYEKVAKRNGILDVHRIYPGQKIYY